MRSARVLFIVWASCASIMAQTDPGMTIRARQVIDGRGGVTNNATLSIKNGKIVNATANETERRRHP